MLQRLQQSLEQIKTLCGQISLEKQRLQAAEAEIIQIKTQKSVPETLMIKKLKEVNKNLKIEQSQILMHKNKATLEIIRDVDQNLYGLIKRYQAEEQANLDYNTQLESQENKRKQYLKQYNLITHSFAHQERLKLRTKELENDFRGKMKNVEFFMNRLTALKQKILSPEADAEEIESLITLHKSLLTQKFNLQKQNSNLIFDINEISSKIKTESAPRKKPLNEVKLQIKTTQIKINQTNIAIGNLEKIHKEALENYKRLKEARDSVQGSKNRIKKKYIFESERNSFVRELGCVLKEGKSTRAISAIKSISKPGTPAATKLVELNRSHFLFKD
jgi:hypothetical protein